MQSSTHHCVLAETGHTDKVAGERPGREERGEKADRTCFRSDNKEENLFLYLQ